MLIRSPEGNDTGGSVPPGVPGTTVPMTPTLAFGQAAFSFGIACVLACILVIWHRTVDASHWDRVPCTIEKSEVRNTERGMPHLRFSYRYSYRGSTYTSDRYSFDGSADDKARSQIISAHPVGESSHCLVNPEHPDSAVMVPGVPAVFNLYVGLFGLAAVSCVVFTCVGIWLRLTRGRHGPMQPPVRARAPDEASLVSALPTDGADAAALDPDIAASRVAALHSGEAVPGATALHAGGTATRAKEPDPIALASALRILQVVHGGFALLAVALGSIALGGPALHRDFQWAPEIRDYLPMVLVAVYGLQLVVFFRTSRPRLLDPASFMDRSPEAATLMGNWSFLDRFRLVTVLGDLSILFGPVCGVIMVQGGVSHPLLILLWVAALGLLARHAPTRAHYEEARP